MRKLLVAIFARDAEEFLPVYLKMIRSLTAHRECFFWVRTNDNTDKTAEILEEWLKDLPESSYYYNSSSIDKHYERHVWNPYRLRIMSRLRQASIDYAWNNGMDYFTIDVDNFVIPGTLQKIESLNLPVIAPMIVRHKNTYANFFCNVDAQGYSAEAPWVFPIMYRALTGVFRVPLVHHVYLIQHAHLQECRYYDGSNRHEFVIFAESLRKAGVEMYIDNREDWGRIYQIDPGSSLEEEDAGHHGFFTRMNLYYS